MRLDPNREALLKQHLAALNLKTEDDYYRWCRTNFFSTAVNKNAEQYRKEQQYYRTKIFSASLKKSNSVSFEKGIEQICEGTYKSTNHKVLDEIDRWYRGKSLIVSNPPARKFFSDFILYLYEKSKLLDTPQYLKALVSVLTYKFMWIRDYKDWSPKSYNVARQFGSFVRHLFCKYPVPNFMDAAWDRGDVSVEWFIHVGEGQNIRTALKIPFPLTKKEAHYFMETPDSWDIPQAFWYGVILALGGTPRLAEAVRRTKIVQHARHKDFSVSVIKFFIDNPMLDLAHAQPIVDYLWHLKYENQRVFVGRGVAEDRPPPQPNLSMAGRTPETLLAHVERWHRQLGKESKGGDLQWEKDVTIKDYELKAGSEKDPKFWTIIELLSSKELASEGRALLHCVYSYAYSCFKGQTSIWSLRLDGKRLVTLEVRHKDIVQARGYGNRNPTQGELLVIGKWAHKERLNMRYVL